MSPTSYQAALPRVIPSLLSATLIIIPYSNGFVKRVRKVFLQRKQRMKMRLLTFFPENQQPRQFTPLRERRQSANVSVQVINQFQFTPLREGRLTGSAPVFNAFYFNSRPSARGDKTGLSRYIFLSISIHSPPRGATVHFSFGTFSTQISIHAPPRGATGQLIS